MAHLCQDFSPIVALKDHLAVADEARIPHDAGLSEVFFEKYPGLERI